MASVKFPPGGPMKVQCFYNFNPTQSAYKGQDIPCGFSETYWVQQASPSGAKTVALDVVNARMKTFAPDVSLVSVRITDTSVLRKPLLIDPAAPNSGVVSIEGSYAVSGQTTPQASVHPQLGMLHRLTGGDNSYNLRFYHCPPSSIYASEEQLNTDDVTWGPLYQAWLLKLQDTQLITHQNGVLTAEAIITPQFVGLRSRKVGRPFGLFRGSRPIR